MVPVDRNSQEELVEVPMDLEHPARSFSDDENLNLNLGFQRPEILPLSEQILTHLNST